MENIVLEERSDMRGTYLVAAGCEEGGYKEEMLKNSRIPGLLTVTGQDFNGRHELWYETTARQALKQKFSQKAPGVEEITELMQQMGALAQRLEEYLLEAEEIVPKLSCIFEGEEGEILFLYVPGYPRENPSGVCRLLEEMMEYVNYEDHRAVSFLYLLHARSRQQTCGIFSLHRLCAEILEAAQAEEERRRNDNLFEDFEEMDEEGGSGQNDGQRNGLRDRLRNGLKSEHRDGRGNGLDNERRNGLRNERRSELRKGLKNELENERKSGLWKGLKNELGSEGKSERKSGLGYGLKNGKETIESGSLGKKEKAAGGFYGLLQRVKGYIKKEIEENSETVETLEECETLGETCEPCEMDGLYGDTVLLMPEEQSETVLLTGDPDTVLLQEQERWVLEPEEKGRERILLKGFPFCIGKEDSDSGYTFWEPVISRRHAQILKEGMRYFLVDKKSLNGTYLNGERLAANERKELKDGDRISFADICFIFTCCKSPNGI